LFFIFLKKNNGLSRGSPYCMAEMNRVKIQDRKKCYMALSCDIAGQVNEFSETAKLLAGLADLIQSC